MDWPSLTRILSTPCSFQLHILFIFVLCYLFLESRWVGDIKVSGKLCFRIRSFNTRMRTHTSIHLTTVKGVIVFTTCPLGLQICIQPSSIFRIYLVKIFSPKADISFFIFNVVLIEKRWKTQHIYIYIYVCVCVCVNFKLT